jgi:hypothetical protein
MGDELTDDDTRVIPPSLLLLVLLLGAPAVGVAIEIFAKARDDDTIDDWLPARCTDVDGICDDVATVAGVDGDDITIGVSAIITGAADKLPFVRTGVLPVGVSGV